jgi:hypothetical protein
MGIFGQPGALLMLQPFKTQTYSEIPWVTEGQSLVCIEVLILNSHSSIKSGACWQSYLMLQERWTGMK